MSNHVSHAALPYPIKNARFSLIVPYLDADGDPLDPTTPDTEFSTDNATFADCAEEVTTTAGTNGIGYITLTGAETNASMVAIAAKVASGPKNTLATLYPRVLAIVGSGTLSAGSAGGGTLGSLLAYDVTGCFIRSTGGTGGGGTGGANNQARKIITYNVSTGAFTVAPNWETTPDNTTTYDVLLPDGVTLGMLKALNPTTAGRTLNVDTSNKAPATIAVGDIANDAITAAAIADNAIDAGAIASNAITAAKIASDAITAAKIADGAIDAATFAAGAINAAAIAADAITDAKVASDVTIASVTGAVGSIATGGITAGSFAAGAIDNAAIAADAIGSSELATSAITEIQSGLATSSALTTLDGKIGTPSNLGGGATIAANLSDIEGQTDDIGAAGAGLTAADDAILTAIAALNNLSAAQVNAEVDTALADYDAPTRAELTTDINTVLARLPAALTANGNLKASLVEVLTTALTEAGTGQLAGGIKKFFDKATPTGTINSIPDAVAGATNGIAIVGSAMGLAANAVDAAAMASTADDEIAAAILDLANGVESGVTVRKVLRLLAAALGGKVTGLDVGTPTYRNIGDTKNVIAGVTDVDGNRSSMTLDLT